MYRLAAAGFCMLLLALGHANAGAVCSTGTSVYCAIQTNIQGAQTGIDAMDSSMWTFTVGTSWDFGGGTFTMKAGSSVAKPSSTNPPIVLSVYSGTNFGTLVGSTSLSPTQFCGQLGSCQSFGAVQFAFATPLALSANTAYFADLSSSTGTSGSDQYFIKGTSSTLAFVDSNNNPIPAQDLITTTSSVPEPTTLAMTALAIGGCALARRRVRKAALVSFPV